MKQIPVLKRWMVAAGLCLLLVGLLALSLAHATGQSVLPVAVLQTHPDGPSANPVEQTAHGEVIDLSVAQSAPNRADRFTRNVSTQAPAPQPDAGREVQDAWKRAQETGVYAFATDLVQVIYPARTLANAGRGPNRVQTHMEGKIDQPARVLEFRLSRPDTNGSGGAASGAEVRVEGDRAYTRRAGSDEAWQEVEDFSANFAPDNDPLAFLAGITNIREVPAEAWDSRGAEGQRSEAGEAQGEDALTDHVSRFTFQLDGPALATYLRDRLEREMARHGELPPGMSLDVSSAMRDMTGDGELWVDSRGFPLRLSMHLAAPEQSDGTRVEAEIQTDFSGFPEQIAAGPKITEEPLAWAGRQLTPEGVRSVAEAGGRGGILVCGIGVIALLLACRRSRRLYVAAVVAVILSMVLIPLMQSERATAFFERQATRAQGLMSLGADGQAVDAKSAQAQEAARQAIADRLAPAWDPQQDPLAEPDPAAPGAEAARGVLRGASGPTPPGHSSDADSAARTQVSSLAPAVLSTTGALVCNQDETADDDKDGVNNREECVYFTNSLKDDSDGDGLTDGQELNKLATNPNAADTDGDLITDAVEVQGFDAGNKRWYLDPNNADTNNDGVLDGVECPKLVDPNQGCDTDGDGIPNPFENDNDADGVPDRVDLSPDQWADRSGLRTGQASAPAPFDGSNPFKLSVPGLTDGWPVLVDLQFRPTSAAHLGYAMNVLDWPAGDIDGEIQHGKATTFADSDNPDVKNPDDEAGAHGDMRLVPLLEILMTGDEIPLKLTTPAVTITVGSDTALASTVVLKPTADTANTQISWTLPQNGDLKIYAGRCSALGAQLGTTYTGTSGAGTLTGKVVGLADGNHSAVVTVGTTSACAELTDLINGRYTDEMVDTSVLDPYGILVKEGYGADDGVVVAYVPLNVIPDDTGGGKTAFQARMIYYTGGKSHWIQPSQTRVVWLVQTITDSCGEGVQTWDEYQAAHPDKSQTDYDAYVDTYCAANRTVDQIVPVQVYDESWYLTGLSVQEARGVDIAVAYPNPDLTYSDDALWTLSWGLGQQYITGRDCESRSTIFAATNPTTPTCVGNKLRDLAVFAKDGLGRDIGDSTIQERFDNTTSNTTHRSRWGIPSNALEVDSFRYPHEDYLSYLASKDTPAILAKYTNHSLNPSLLFVYEARSRVGDLTAASMTSGAPLTVDMDISKRLEQTATGMKWAPFRYDPAIVDGKAVGWETYPSSEYWDAQETDLRARFTALFGSDSEATRMGRVTTARSYTVALIIGVGNAVYCTPDQKLCTSELKGGASDLEIKQADDTMLNSGLNHVTVEVMSDTMEARKSLRANDAAFDLNRNAQTVDLSEMITAMSLGQLSWANAGHPEVSLFEALGSEVLTPGASPWQAVFTGGPSVAMTGSMLTGSAVTTIITTIKTINEWTMRNMGLSLLDLADLIYEIGYAIAGGILIIFGSYKILWTAAETVVQAARSLMGWSKNFLDGKGGVLGAALTVLTLAYYWGTFALLVGFEKLPPGSMAFDEVLVETIAYTIFTIAWFIITTCLGPLGTILSGIKMILNVFAGAMCDAFLTEEEQEEANWAKWVCGGITGFFVEYYTAILYSGTLIPDLDPDEEKGPPWYPRLSMYGFEAALVDGASTGGERGGVVVGNSMRFSIGLTNTIDLSDVPLRTHEIFWSWQFSDEELARSSFDYRWQDKQTDFHNALSLGGMTWQKTGGGRPFYHTETVESGDFPFTGTGINRPVTGLYLSEAYAVPEQECWGYFTAKYCYIATEKGTVHMDMGEEMVHDVLPPTLSGFYALTPVEGGYALSWGQEGDLKFPMLYDADGDGLSWADDPNDQKWDADDDGLSDASELSNGPDPKSLDSDNDGLTDTQEIRFGSNPWSDDTDGDGLLDCQEVYHLVESEGDSAARAVCDGKGSWSGGWTIVYKMDAGQKSITRVTSSPLLADTDGDGINDAREKVYGYNPRAYSVLKVLTLDSSLSEEGKDTDGFVARGQALSYAAKVTNELDNRQAEGLLWPATSSVFQSSVKPQSFDLRPLAQANMAGSLAVKPDAAAGTYDVTQVAGALITDPTVESGSAKLWLPFDDPVGSTVFADKSGQEPAHDGRCQGVCTLQPADGRAGGALKLAGTGYVRSDAPLSDGSYSVSFWFRVDAANGSSGVLFSTADNYRMTLSLFEGRIQVRIPSSYSQTEREYADGVWHHVAYTDPGTDSSATVYVDGDPILYPTRNSYTARTQGVLIGGNGTSNLVGAIDDVRLYEDAITPQEVQELFDMPLFQMDFNQTSTWTDVSNLPATVSCTKCPGRTTWSGGGAATFDGTQYLSVASTSKLDLHLGRFTLSAWIKPLTRGDSRDTFPQAILGWHAGQKDAYPTLERIGKQIRFGLGARYAWQEVYTSGAVLTENQWNHVAVAVDKEAASSVLRLYVNGNLMYDSGANISVSTVDYTQQFEIGRDSNAGSLYLHEYHQDDSGDTNVACNLQSNGSESCMSINDKWVWNQGGLECGDNGSLFTTVDFTDTAILRLWEDDTNPQCGDTSNGDDQKCTFGTAQELQFNTTQVSGGEVKAEFTNCGSGHFFVTYTNKQSVPFYGQMDEVQIFGQPFDQDGISRLYQDVVTAIHLPLDEAPGASAFEDVSLAHVPASCVVTGDACPTTGTPGRLNQAAWFDGANDNIKLGAFGNFSQTTVSAWVYRAGDTGKRETIVSYKEDSSCGFVLALENDAPVFYVRVGSAWKSVPASTTIGQNQWVHLAGTYDGSKIRLYRDGKLVAEADAAGSMTNTCATATTAIGSRNENNQQYPHWFPGAIDDVWIFSAALPDDKIAQLYDSAPNLHLLLDDAYGATHFVDNAVYGRYGTCANQDVCPLAGEGVRGQVGLAAEFDGVNDYVKVDNFGTFGATTVSAWVNRKGATAARETIVSYKEDLGCGFVLALENQVPKFWVNVGGSWKSVTGGATQVPLNQWVHLAGTYDGKTLRLYRNGVEAGNFVYAGSMLNTCTSAAAIGSRNSLDQHWFPGTIDQVRIYGRALTANQIRDQFLYEDAWVEDRQSQTITVDTDLPTAEVLMADGSYLARQEIWVGARASDPTSDVAKLELGVQQGSGSVVWTTAAPCAADLEMPKGAWCARFTPSAQGEFGLYARATDVVGNLGPSSAKVTVYVDDSAPTLTLDQASAERLEALQSKNKEKVWIVHLSGKVSDPYIVATTVPGSGVPADGVRVTLREAGDPEDKGLGDVEQVAAISGDTWSLDYTFSKKEADGCYEVEVEAVDQVSRLPGLDPTQLGRHTTMVVDTMAPVEASAPQVLLDQASAIAGGQLGPAAMLLGGETTHRPVPVEVELTATTGADKTRVLLTCQHGNAGDWYTVFDLQAGALKAGGTQTWDGELHHWSTCRVELTTTATPAGGVSGVVKVCGTQIADWPDSFAGSYTGDFVVNSDTCGAPGCPVSSPPPVAGIAGVDLAFRSILPGSPFINEAPLTGEVLHLPFEDTPDSSNGLTLRDVSGAGLNGTCSEGTSSSCPTTGQAGPSGSAAWLDGAKDYVQVVDDNRWDFAANQDFSVAVWVRPDPVQPDTRYTDHSIIEKWSASGGYPYVIRYADQNDKTIPGKIIAARYQGTQPQPVIYSDRTINDGRFHHLVFVKSGSTLTLYIDSKSAGTTTDNTTGTTTNSSALFIGQRGGGSNHFAGLVDDVRIFNRGLSAAEVNTLYTGSDPVLILPFEEAWATDGASLPDDSGWGHDGTLEAGADTANNKATTGQVGSFALKLDGADDNVQVADFGAFGVATASGWIYRTKADTARQTVVSYKENLGCGFTLAVEGNVPKFWVNVGGAWRGPAVGSTQVSTNQWEHLAGSYDGSTIRVYRNGVQVGAYAYAGNMKNDCTDTTAVGSRNDNKQHWFPGTIDEVRIYGRALPALEIADLYHAGWQAATLPPSSVPVERSSWTASVPAGSGTTTQPPGLEGSYQIEMRGRDDASHSAAINEPSMLWRGEADNVPPRVKLSLNATTNQYTTVAEDYHLAETSFSSPCGAGVITTRETFRSPWYLGRTGDQQKLYRLTAVCPKPAGTVTEQAKACDSFGNCATAGVTAAAQAAEGELAAAAQPASTGPAAIGQLAVSPDKAGPTGFEISVPAVVTATHYYEPRTIDVVGAALAKGNPAADGRALAGVQVAIANTAGPALLSEPAAQRPYTVTWTFPWRQADGVALPDGITYTAIITATDLDGRVTTVNRMLTADVVPPTPVNLSLTSSGQPVAPDATIRKAPAGLTLAWTPSSDGGGLAPYPYRAVWRIEDAAATTTQTSQHGPDDRLAHLTGGEAQRISVGLASQDSHGNERWQEFGSVLVDSPLTPDFITPFTPDSLGDESWMTSGCTLVGADRRVTRLGSSRQWQAQQGYVTWDHRALRLAWTGANWSGDGDLFIYLDTAAGGTNTTFTPDPVPDGETPVLLPADLPADVVIWVQDAHTASLLRWDGLSWSDLAPLTAAQYRFNAAHNGGQTDLYLPFDRLGMSAGAPLGALAFAAEEPAPETGLHIWATLPLANPLNSGRVNPRLALAPAGDTMLLRHAHRWEALGDGACPNGTNGTLAAEQHSDARLRLLFDSDPPGATASGISGGLFWVSNPSDNLGASVPESLLSFVYAAHSPVPDGQAIAYTVRYHNEGSHTLANAWLELSALGALQLADKQIALGDIPPGGEGSVTFSGTVDQSLSSYRLAAALLRLHASTSGTGEPLEWLAAAHRVDRDAPEQVGLDGAATLVGPEIGWLAGSAHDVSGVRKIEIAITPASGPASTLTCNLSGLISGGWSCPWDAMAANGGVRPQDGAEFTVRLRATDRFNYTSDWSEPRTIRVDAQPPTVTLAAEATGVLPVRLVRGNTLRLTGETRDNDAVKEVTVCLDDEICRSADLQGRGTAANSWSRWMIAPGALDYVTRTVSVRATDRLGNRMAEPQEISVVFDNVAPILSADQLRTRVPIGSTDTILSGTASDGGPDVTVSVRIQPPTGAETRQDAARAGTAWWFDLPANAPGHYTLWIDARDLAGNLTTAGPFTVEVTCTDAAPIATSLTAEPVAGSPVSLTVTAVISNTGPDPLPAGIPVVLSEGDVRIGAATTTAPLGAGESQALTFDWAPTGARDYDIAVTVGPINDLPDGPLCTAPPTARFPVSLRVASLYYRWNLVALPVNPSSTAAEVVQRGIDGAYAAILGYEGGLQAYYPDRPEDSTLTTIDAAHGYWIKTSLAPGQEMTDTLRFEPVATWRMAGQLLPEDQPLPLKAGWNLTGYLPRQPLTVTAALQGIAGGYDAVLGFERTALSYYPDLDASYNTLRWMAPGYGYWITTTQAITLHYPLTAITDTLSVTARLMMQERLRAVRLAEWEADVVPTYEWMNFYGKLARPDGTGVPTETVVLAVDPQGVICGATTTWETGQYGLLACYADDPDTAADEGATPGDAIRLVVAEGSPPRPGSWTIGQGNWVAHGARQQVSAGPAPEPRKTYLPLLLKQENLPGDTAQPLPESNPGS